MATLTVMPGYFLTMDQSTPDFVFSSVFVWDETTIEVESTISGLVLELYGHFTLDEDLINVTGGTINNIVESLDFDTGLTYTGGSIDVLQFLSDLTTTEDHLVVFSLILSGNDLIKSRSKDIGFMCKRLT